MLAAGRAWSARKTTRAPTTTRSRGGKTGGAGGIGGAGGDDGDDRRDGRTPYPPDKVSEVDAVNLDSSDDESEAKGPGGKGGGNGGFKGNGLPLRPGTPPGYAPGTRVTVDPKGCSPPAGFVNLGDDPGSSHTNSLHTIEEDPEPALVATLRRWQSSVPGYRGGGPSSPPAVSGGKRGPPLTPPSLEQERYGNSVGGDSPPSGPVLHLETAPAMACLYWTMEPLLHGPLATFLDFLVASCEAEENEELRDALLEFLAAFSTAALRLYWAGRGL